MTRLPRRDDLPVPVRRLVAVLADPGVAASLDLAAWDGVVRAARSAQLLGTLGARLEAAGVAPSPAPVRDHLRGALHEARFLHAMAAQEMDAVAAVLAPLRMPCVLLKGAAFLAAGLPHARGRWLRDVDVLVPAPRLDEAERALLAAGWQCDAGLDAYDQRYYRAWSHQIPPLRRPLQPLELDVHHTILPPTGRIHPDADALLRDAAAVDGGWRVPAAADQVVHAAVHLFQDSDCTSRLRDVVDVDALCRHHARHDPAFWPRLFERATLHGAQRPLAYALAFARGWMGTPVDAAFVDACAGDPRWRVRDGVVRRAALALPPPDPESGRTAAQRRASAWLLARSLWLRMPPAMLARHAATKAWRAMSTRRATPAG